MMKTKNASLHLRVNSEMKQSAENVFNDLGITVADAVNMFLYKAVIVGGIPFDVRKTEPNAETLSAIKEVEEMKKNPSKGKSYTDVDEMMKELLA